MNRCLALLCAILFAFVSVSSACMAAPSDALRFTLEPERGNERIHASFRDESREVDRTNWSSGFVPSELIGLDLAGFRASGTRPLRFALVREAGRLDCAGSGGASHAYGNCTFTPAARFTQLLESRGIGRPSREQAFGLMALNVGRELVDAVAAARYPTPTIDQLMAMTAVGVNGRYVTGLAQAGYRPASIDTLVEFRALGISPEWIGGFARIGYAALPADGLVQLRALNVTPEFISGFERMGYHRLPVDTLVQLKALEITPEFVRSAVGPGTAMPPVNDLVELKIFGRKH
jgi:hypothetical protein